MSATILRKRSIWWILAVFALVASALLLWRAAEPFAEFPVTLLTVSSDPKHGQVALFKVANESETTIDGRIFFPQVKSRGAWSQLLLSPNPKSFRLRPGQAFKFSIAAPTNAFQWRLPVRWHYESKMAVRGGIMGIWELNVEANWNALRQGTGLRFIRATEPHMSYSTVIINRD
jgi:hypothetical protein